MSDDPLRDYEEAHELLVVARMEDSTFTATARHEPGVGLVPIPEPQPELIGYKSAQTLAPYIEAEASLLREFGDRIGWYRGDHEHRDAMRLRFGHACRALAVDLLSYASTLTFEGYDLPKKLQALLDENPLSGDEDSDEG
jgi:hypothetical protein